MGEPSSMADGESAVRVESPDSGLLAFVFLLRFLGQPADIAQLRHQFAPDGELFTADAILRAAKRLGIKARRERTSPQRLEKATLPAIALLKDGTFALLARAAPDRVLLQDLLTGRPAVEQRAAFDERWSGELILMTTLERMVGAARPFDVTWFIPSIVRLRKLLGEALVGSLFLQLFALITPLFTQVVIDKVLVHKGWSTLDVLVFGLVVISVFEIVLGGLRSYVLAHTTNRIDVELGARLFRHLVSLPLGYFGVRRVGDSVARVRELENIRQFLTGQELADILELAHTSHRIADPAHAEIAQRQADEMAEQPGAQLDVDAVGGVGQHVGAQAAQHDLEHRDHHQAEHQHVERAPALVDQHLVDHDL